MIVSELIILLNTFDKSLPVVIRGYESGVNDVSRVIPVYIERNAHTEDYYGQHEQSTIATNISIPALELWGENKGEPQLCLLK